MTLLENIEDKMKDMMDDPQKREHLEQMAKEKGISVEEAARQHFSKDRSQEQ